MVWQMESVDATSGRSSEVFFFGLSERQKIGISVFFFVRDVVSPINAECSAKHLPMTGIEPV